MSVFEKMDITYKYQVAEKQAFGAPKPKRHKGHKPTNRISEGYANAIRASNTNGYIANANMMSYKSGEDYLRHNQPRLNTVLSRLKNAPSTLNMNYYGNKVDPVEVRNYQFAKGPDAYNATNTGEMRFATYHARDRDPLQAAAPPAPAYAGPHAHDIGVEVGNALSARFDALQQDVRNLPRDIDQALGPRIQQMAPYSPEAIATAIAGKVGFVPHPVSQQQPAATVNPVLPAGAPRGAWGGNTLGILSPRPAGSPLLQSGSLSPTGTSIGGLQLGVDPTRNLFNQAAAQNKSPPPRPIPAPPAPPKNTGTGKTKAGGKKT